MKSLCRDCNVDSVHRSLWHYHFAVLLLFVAFEMPISKWKAPQCVCHSFIKLLSCKCCTFDY
uniref:Ovule protein n=1 Tax=Ascaris lumbricoides TaxID=6252 RepID=A0A0M3IXH7_ASCLU